MASESRTDAHTAAANATRAVALHRGWGMVIAEREAQIVDDMVHDYRAGKATGEHLLAKVAAISELRKIESELDRDAKLSIEKATQAMGANHG